MLFSHPDWKWKKFPFDFICVYVVPGMIISKEAIGISFEFGDGGWGEL